MYCSRLRDGDRRLPSCSCPLTCRCSDGRGTDTCSCTRLHPRRCASSGLPDAVHHAAHGFPRRRRRPQAARHRVPRPQCVSAMGRRVARAFTRPRVAAPCNPYRPALLAYRRLPCRRRELKWVALRSPASRLPYAPQRCPLVELGPPPRARCGGSRSERAHWCARIVVPRAARRALAAHARGGHKRRVPQVRHRRGCCSHDVRRRRRNEREACSAARPRPRATPTAHSTTARAAARTAVRRRGWSSKILLPSLYKNRA